MTGAAGPASAPGGVPRPGRGAKRGQILEGAKGAFLRDGFSGASMDRIAREAGVSKPTLYAYYPGKEELFADVLRALTVGDPGRPMPVGDGPPRSREELRGELVAVGRWIVATMMDPEYLALFRTLVFELPRFPRLAGMFRSGVPGRALGGVGALLERARESGVADFADLDAAARTFAGAVVTFPILDGLYAADASPREPPPERIEAIVDLYLRAVAPGG